MGTGMQVKLDDYLQNLSDSSCEYVDGHLIEKPVPTWMHSFLQIWIGGLIMRAHPEYLAGSEVHARLSDDEYRIPDIAIQSWAIAKAENIAKQPPLLCIEILSAEDRLGATFAKSERYHDWGVPMCWVIDPLKQRAWSYATSSEPMLQEVSLGAGAIKLSVAEIFAPLNQPLQ